MEITVYSAFRRMCKETTPTNEEIEEGALVLYENRHLETISGHIRFFNKRNDGSDEWTAGSSDDVTDDIDCWFKKVK